MQYEDGTKIYVGDRVKLENGELGKIVDIFLDESAFFKDPTSKELSRKPGVVILTDAGARVVITQPFYRDFYPAK